MAEFRRTLRSFMYADSAAPPWRLWGGSLLFTLICSATLAAGTKGTVVITWNDAALANMRGSQLSPPAVARALAIVNSCMYEAWAAYDERAAGMYLSGALRRPAPERTIAQKQEAVSFAAFRALLDVLPAGTNSVYRPLMKQLGYDPDDLSKDIETPSGIGNVACGAVLEFRHQDNSNQLGDLSPGAYSDWSGYRPVNSPGTVPARAIFTKPLNPEHWQPLSYTDASGSLVLQMFDAPQWCFVKPFAMLRGDQFRALVEPGPFKYGSQEYQREAEEVVAISGRLGDEEKVVAEYWSGGSDSQQVLENWVQFAEWVSARDGHTLDEDVKMFFTLANTLLDASIATWDAKRAYDSVRPVTAIPLLFRNKTIRAWAGPGKGNVAMDGYKWIPYQPATSPTPPSPEYVSATSSYSSAAATILKLWTASDSFGYSTTRSAGSSVIEPHITPTHDVLLSWPTFSSAAAAAGATELYAGVGFRHSERSGRLLGAAVAGEAWKKAQGLFRGVMTMSSFGANPPPLTR